MPVPPTGSKAIGIVPNPRGTGLPTRSDPGTGYIQGVGSVVRPDDILDAAVAVWSADRLARGLAQPIPGRSGVFGRDSPGVDRRRQRSFRDRPLASRVRARFALAKWASLSIIAGIGAEKV